MSRERKITRLEAIRSIPGCEKHGGLALMFAATCDDCAAHLYAGITVFQIYELSGAFSESVAGWRDQKLQSSPPKDRS